MKHVWAMHARTCMCLSVCVRAHIDFRPGLHFYNKRLSMKVNLTNTSVWFMHKHTHAHKYLSVCVCVCVCRCESMWHTMRCRYVCMGVFVSGIYVCTNIRILLTEFAAAAAVAKQNTPQHTTHNRSQHSTTQHNTTQQNKTHSNAIRSVRRLTRLLGMKVDL